MKISVINFPEDRMSAGAVEVLNKDLNRLFSWWNLEEGVLLDPIEGPEDEPDILVFCSETQGRFRGQEAWFAKQFADTLQEFCREQNIKIHGCRSCTMH